MTARSQRALRGAAAALVAVLLAALSHTLGGGPAPSGGVLSAVAGLVWPASTFLVGRRLSSRGLASSVLASQGALHAAFAITAGWSPGVPGAHSHGAPISLPPSSAIGDVVAPGGAMFLAHFVAAAAAFALLHQGERVISRILRWVVRRAARVLPALPAAPRTRAIGPREPPPRPRRSPHLTRLTRRGPPFFSGDVRVA